MVDNAFLGIRVCIMQLESNQLLTPLKEKIESMIVATTIEHFASSSLVRVSWISPCVMWLNKEWLQHDVVNLSYN